MAKMTVANITKSIVSVSLLVDFLATVVLLQLRLNFTIVFVHFRFLLLNMDDGVLMAFAFYLAFIRYDYVRTVCAHFKLMFADGSAII